MLKSQLIYYNIYRLLTENIYEAKLAADHKTNN